jgi:hypothetical protein
MDNDNTEDYQVVWALEARAEQLGWHRTKRKVLPRKITVTFVKDQEPEPREGGTDPA